MSNPNNPNTKLDQETGLDFLDEHIGDMPAWDDQPNDPATGGNGWHDPKNPLCMCDQCQEDMEY